jgi:fructokinase
MNHKIICFGETLWDMLPSGHLPGGAPMNVAIHLKYQQHAPLIISRVGTDDLGEALLDFLQTNELSTRYIQVGKTHLTGVVKVNMDDKNDITYKIVEPVAWDYIQYEEAAARLVRDSDVFLFGSLASRNPTTRATLLQYLPLARYKVFDVNLRPPYYSPEGILALLHHADLVKMNHQELAQIAGWIGLAAGSEQQLLQAVKDRFDLQLVLVTRGENGAAVLSAEGYCEHPGYPVTVADTIGSGDAFLATFLSHFLRQQALPVCLQQACLVGAFVASRPGATPAYHLPQLEASFAAVAP